MLRMPLFKSYKAEVSYDIGLVLGHINEGSDAVKYQILTSRDYLPNDFQFPLNDNPYPKKMLIWAAQLSALPSMHAF